MAVAGQEVRWVRTKLRLATKPPSVLTFTPQQQQQQQWRTRVPRSDWLARVVVIVFFARADGEFFFHGRVRNIHATVLAPAVML